MVRRKLLYDANGTILSNGLGFQCVRIVFLNRPYKMDHGFSKTTGKKEDLVFAQHHRDQWRSILAPYTDVVLMGDLKTQERKTDLPAVSVPVVVVAGDSQNRMLHALFQLRTLFFQDQTALCW